ncbi:MAG: efflux RND transporter periplasmic adaptor subunit [Deltaproteobacteria bacterium]|nr:MAG: efflux RND transporter periplasmic adaptor subunit [Deltaproteobacteria bacterium]
MTSYLWAWSRACKARVWMGLFGLTLLLGCKHSHHDHGGHSHGGHSHGGHGGHGGHGHGHGHGEEGDTVAVTLYTERTELFMEYTKLVSGKKASFLAHLTVLGKTFKPVTSGYLKVMFVQGGVRKHTIVARSVLRKGIFKPVGKAPAPGKYKLVMSLTSPQVLDTLVLPVVVYANEKEAKAAKPKADEEGDISFLKEQQWNLPFANQPLAQRTMRKSLDVVGSIEPKSGHFARVTAPASGVVEWLSPKLQEGVLMKRGQLLLRITPQLFAGTDLPQLQQVLSKVKSSYEQAVWELRRLRRMAKQRAVAPWQLKQAQVQKQQWKDQWDAAKRRLRLFRRTRMLRTNRGHSIQLRVPLTGSVTKLLVTPGMFVEQGRPLLTLINRKKLTVEAMLPEASLSELSKVTDASMQVGSRWLGLGPVLRKGVQLDETTRTFPLFFDLPAGEFWVGQHTKVQLHLQSRKVLAVPVSAILDDKGKSVVFVQNTGESFSKREVVLGIRDRDWVEVRSGVRAGERVVVTGAYEIMISQALKQGGAVGHGHAH